MNRLWTTMTQDRLSNLSILISESDVHLSKTWTSKISLNNLTLRSRKKCIPLL